MKSYYYYYNMFIVHYLQKDSNALYIKMENVKGKM